MKKAASFAARVAVAVMIAAAVAFAQYWIWQQLNRSTEFIGTNQSIKGFAYNGFQRDQSPLKQSYPTREQLAGDLDLLARISDGLRVVDSGLVAGDRVIVNGVQRVFMPGMPVTPQAVAMRGGEPVEAAEAVATR